MPLTSSLPLSLLLLAARKQTEHYSFFCASQRREESQLLHTKNWLSLWGMAAWGMSVRALASVCGLEVAMVTCNHFPTVLCDWYKGWNNWLFWSLSPNNECWDSKSLIKKRQKNYRTALQRFYCFSDFVYFFLSMFLVPFLLNWA